ncbi:MAG: hypothetical protein DRR06_20380 [Gammaproteobacteria bacterium]|nr:MAG: hypothetical protein DRR06_20380 [Gammaproteobacteria bacterium]
MAIEENEIHLNDVGTVFEVTLVESDVVVDISTATTLTIKFKKSDGATVMTKTASFSTDGTDGRLQYTSVADDLDQTGPWKLQAYVIMPSWTGHSSIGEFEVFRNL